MTKVSIFLSWRVSMKWGMAFSSFDLQYFVAKELFTEWNVFINQISIKTNMTVVPVQCTIDESIKCAASLRGYGITFDGNINILSTRFHQFCYLCVFHRNFLLEEIEFVVLPRNKYEYIISTNLWFIFDFRIFFFTLLCCTPYVGHGFLQGHKTDWLGECVWMFPIKPLVCLESLFLWDKVLLQFCSCKYIM